MVWSHRLAGTWYKNKKGRVFANSPWRLVDYWSMTRRMNPDDFLFEVSSQERERTRGTVSA
jgi:4-hydroxyacetophenone monooxygenase